MPNSGAEGVNNEFHANMLQSLVLYCQRVEKYHSSMENAKMIASFLDAAIYSDKSKSINTEFYAFIRWLIVDTAYFVSNGTVYYSECPLIPI